MDKRIEDLIPFYILGGLTADERAEVEAFAKEHPQTQAELDDLMAVTAMLPYTVPPQTPGPEVKQDLLHRVNQDAHRRRSGQARPATVEQESRPGLLAWLRGQAAGLALAGVMVILIFFVGGWALGLNQTVQSQNQQLSVLEKANTDLSGRVADLEIQLTALETENANLRENNNLLAAENTGLGAVVATYESLLATDAVVTTLEGTENQPDGVAQLVTSADGKTAFLVVSGLEPLAEGLAYQVLLIYDEGHDTAETFLVDTTGHGVSLVSAEGPLLDNYTAVGVSIEPEGGSEQRTGDIVLLGTIGS
jgi:anti-sigma-K factor RskA